jgi:A49-like RNA polymerase I associated factor
LFEAMSEVTHHSSKKRRKHRQNATNDGDLMESTATTSSKSTLNDAVKVRIQEPDVLKDPIVCSFPGGVPSAESGASFQWFQKKKPQSKGAPDGNVWVVAGKDSTCEYYGSHGEASSAPRSKLCVGVYDKVTKQLIVYQTACNGTVFTLQQHVPSYQAKVELTVDSSSARSSQELYADFGSVKKQRVLKSQAANRVTVENTVQGTSSITGASLVHGMSESNRQAVLLQQQQIQAKEVLAPSGLAAVEASTQLWRQSFLPPFDPQATNANRVYSALKMAGEEVWNSTLPNLLSNLSRNGDDFVTEITDFLNRNGNADIVQCTETTQNLLRKWNQNQDKLKCSLLFHFFQSLFRSLKSKRSVPQPPSEEVDEDEDLGRGDDHRRHSLYGSTPRTIVQRFFDLFMSPLSQAQHGRPVGYVMSRAHQNKCIVYVLILYMLASNTHADQLHCPTLLPVLLDLQLDVSHATQLLRQAGCNVTKKNAATLLVELSLPLTFPPPPRKRASKR